MRKWLGLSTLTLLLAGGAAAWLGDLDPDVNLSSAAEVWGDVLRDADQLGLRLTRMPDRKEMDLGNRLAAGYSLAGSSDPARYSYVAAVGAALVPYVRRPGIHYTFQVIESPERNAFALPGGHVFIFAGLLADIQSESELAYVLGHEMSHIDLRHAAELYQNDAALGPLRTVPLAGVPELVRRLVARGYSKFQELEADAQGLRMSAQAGYDPGAAARLYNRIRPQAAHLRPASPTGEVAEAVGEQLKSYFDTHPPDEERLRRLEALAARNRARLAGRTLYDGVENYQRQIPRTVQQFPQELRQASVTPASASR
jgi:predicted Zn-dependent protease